MKLTDNILFGLGTLLVAVCGARLAKAAAENAQEYREARLAGGESTYERTITRAGKQIKWEPTHVFEFKYDPDVAVKKFRKNVETMARLVSEDKPYQKEV